MENNKTTKNTCQKCGVSITPYSILCRRCASDKSKNSETVRRVLTLHDAGIPITTVAKILYLSKQRIDQIYKRDRGQYWAAEKRKKKEEERLKTVQRFEQRGNTVKFKCKNCGKPIFWKDADARKKYCSRLCGDKTRRTRRLSKKATTCTGCGIRFFPWVSLPNQKFHNLECYYKNGRNRCGRKMGITAWTSWYCPIENCDTIIYNTSFGSKKEINKHLKEKHGLRYIIGSEAACITLKQTKI